MVQKMEERHNYKRIPLDMLTEAEKMTFMANRMSRKRMGEYLRRERESVGMTVEEASERTGIPPGMIVRTENGRLNIQFDDLTLLAELYGCKIVLTKK